MVDIVTMITTFFTTIIGGYEQNFITLATYTVGMVVYAIVIWHFYRHLAKKEIFKRKRDGGKGGYILKYLILFPLVSFIWFLIFSIFLFFLAKNISVENVLLVSITLISAVRVAAYYSEDLSKDLAKMIPFALLAIFIVDPSYFSTELVLQRINTFPTLFPLVLRYLLFTFVLEIVLRTIYNLATRNTVNKKE